MSYEDQSEDVKALSQREHSRDASAKRMVVRAQDPDTAEWFNIAAVPNGDGTYSLSTALVGQGGIFGDSNTNTPVRVTEDGELMIAQTPQERNLYFGLRVNVSSTTIHRLLLDLSDTTNYPHNSSGRIDLSATYLQVDRSATGTTGAVRVGVITRVSATNADVVYTIGVTFEKSDDRV